MSLSCARCRRICNDFPSEPRVTSRDLHEAVKSIKMPMRTLRREKWEEGAVKNAREQRVAVNDEGERGGRDRGGGAEGEKRR